jgi:hypothetical protein
MRVADPQLLLSLSRVSITDFCRQGSVLDAFSGNARCK